MRVLPPRIVVVLCVGLLALSQAGAALAQKSLRGVALVIGQSAYEHVPALPNPANDAREMVKLLTDLGFDANSVTDRDTRRLRRDLERFVEDAAEADVALLYYSGHGIEAGGENWLLPVDADAASLDDAAEKLVGLSAIIDELKRSVPVTIALLDACRTNPFPPGTLVRPSPDAAGAPAGDSGLTVVRGAAPLNTPEQAADSLGVVIGFAAEPGLPALDGAPGGTSPYATALLRHLAAMQGVEFGSVMRMVTEEVYLSTATKQRPWVNESLRRQLFFGIAPDAPQGDEALITGERRQLLLTIADLPDLSRVQVEQVAARDGVPLDALYGILRALDETAQPKNPDELATMLDAQAERLAKMLAERNALRSDDPEIARLSAAADRAIEEGAIQTARLFMDQAVARVEETTQDVDDLEQMLKDKRIADAAVYAKRADALALVFDFRAAAADYAKAFELVEKWDDDLAWNYLNLKAESLRSHGAATGARAALDEAVGTYEAILRMLPPDDRGRDWAITRNNMAVVLNTIGEMSTGTAELDRAMAIFHDSMAVFEREGDEANWAAAQNNIGNILLRLGERQSSNARLEQALDAFRAALAKRDRAKVPMDWASTQNNIGIATYALAERNRAPGLLAEAETAYRAALEVFTREAVPVEWGMAQNNLGNTLNMLGLVENDRGRHEQALAAYANALEVRSREAWPQLWASTQINLGAAYSNLSRHETGLDSLHKARDSYERALEVFDRDTGPLDWAATQINLGATLQTIGQRSMDAAALDQSLAAFEKARAVYKRKAFPLDWAATHLNTGNTLRLKGTLTGDPALYGDAAFAFKQALREYTRKATPMQWALAQHNLGSALQSLATVETPAANLQAAIKAQRDALDVLTLDNAPVDWANAQNGLGMCLLNLSTLTRTSDRLPEARAAFEAAQKVLTRDTQPVNWAFLENSIGDVHWNLAAQGGGEAEYRRAVAYFESARKAFTEGGQFGPIAIVDQKVGLIEKALEKAP